MTNLLLLPSFFSAHVETINWAYIVYLFLGTRRGHFLATFRCNKYKN